MITLQEFKHRRETLLTNMLPNSIAILAAATEKTRSRDTEYAFRQDSDFFYLTGFNEPDAYLILKKDATESACYLFCRAKDPLAEIWHGRRLGPEQAKLNLHMTETWPVGEFKNQFTTLIDGAQTLYWLHTDHHLTKQVQSLLADERSKARHAKVPQQWFDLSSLLSEMRLIKSTGEINLMQKAADISVAAHKRAMRYCHAGAYEYQLEAEIKHQFAMHGARYEAYASIVAGGENACILHYTENSEQLVDGELVLIDAGCEYAGYAADITRTFPVNGRFSTAQKHIYQLVLDAQEAALKLLKPGSTIVDAQQKVIDVLTSGLIELGLLSGTLAENTQAKDGQTPAYRNFFMHGLGHWLGLDVHDVGDYQVNGASRPLQEGMVLTVEPGLYISHSADVDDCWKGIGVRIEDNIVITADGNQILTADVPKTIADIEQWMQQK